ncbi:exopolysaccharide biosynthesis polyprenyl glycosylphosphotransferase [Butyrivibrio proteoclasticus B316]|uniref:Exopolysaccharide biosynthesis polyprenyl glycosylphosphotransferase n=1 Tax=Butyrivibrio proteoclasticus (strain ATCC 51982 / DSM 14932 / B316) TaxID=515622 RepID=E0RX95_BUTPB|nr:exopolysaccharide biosynthesis polyprenyl glycosylphosphotransferase [Butyrivibrio proteoclasticus]ADL35306.1 exopolysaccharide biosynthesis polyprenyl glycosylphosphotransferase [Butyrivibrio proteoclasticus B316]
MKNVESAKRILVLFLGFVGLGMQTAVYAFFWFKTYYPIVAATRISQDGYVLGGGLKLYFRGHLLILGIYFILLLFFSNTYGGLKIGYLKPMDVFFSQIFALFMVNFISYFQISLLRNWLVTVTPMVMIFLIQLAISFLWAYATNGLYMKIFRPRRLLLVSGIYPVDDITHKFNMRKDKYDIVKSMNISEGIEKIYEECLGNYDGVIIWDVPSQYRNGLVKYCYGRNIRIYVMPKITDVLLKGSTQLHLFDTPVLLLREYAIKVEQRAIKRVIDIVLSLLLIILSSPVMLITAIAIKLYDGGPVLYKQVRCTQNRREFKIMKFRSMRVDAEKDGVARLASKNDSRITPIGKFIRKCRIDELPQLFNILVGDMAFIGPRPERPEIIAQYLEEMPEFAFRMKVKAGLAGYAQVYGKYNTTPYDKLKLDLTYIENYSVWLDIKLMLLTVKILFTPDSTEGVDDNQITAQKNT